MRRHHLASVSLLVAAAIGTPLLLTSCGDDSGGVAQVSGGAAGSGATGAGGLGMSGASAGTAGSDGSGGSTGGSATGGAAGSGVAGGAGAGGKAGAGGVGGAAGNAGNGGVGGNPVVRVYTIEGCDDVGVGGAGGAGAGGADGAGGATDAGGGTGEGGATGPGPLPNLFASFTVYNFETDKPVQTCVGKVADFTITITGDAPLTVATNIAPGVNPASVVWTYDGIAQGPHNIFPYSLGPDDNGDYQEPTPPLAVGAHTLTIRAYDAIDGGGNLLGTMTVEVTVIDGA